MDIIQSSQFVLANFFYVTNKAWKHAYRPSTSPNNLIFVTEGTLYIEMSGTKYAVSENEFLLLPNGVESIGYKPSEKNTAFFFVLFHTPQSFTFPTYFSLQHTDTIQSLFLLLLKSKATNQYPQNAIRSLFHSLLYEIEFQINHNFTCSNKESEKNETLAEKIAHYIKGAVTRNITVIDVANHFGISKDHANRLFSQYAHTTLKAYIIQMRIKEIEKLLISTNTSLPTIAKKLAFPNSQSLSRFYKYHTGKAIREYRSNFIN